MKQMDIKPHLSVNKSSIYTQAKRYTLLLGNGITLYFSTIKDYNYAVSEINRQLNAIVFELNELFICCFTEYRRLWFYIKPNMHYDSEEQQILAKNKEIGNLFEKLSTTMFQMNGNVFCFKNIYQIIELLVFELSILVNIRRGKKQYLEVKIIEVKIKTLQRLHNDLKNITVVPKYCAGKKSKNYSRKNYFNMIPELTTGT